MACIAISDTSVSVVSGPFLDYYDFKDSKHSVINIQQNENLENDAVTDLISSPDGRYLALITSVTKKLVVYKLPEVTAYKSFELPRSASKIRFSSNQKEILVADKSGDALIYNIESEDSGTKLLGHLSLLLDILQTEDGKFIVTCDRDEKIRVSCYPNTYNIQTYCLGHKEFVKHLELLPHNPLYLTSASGDAHINIWDYTTGKLCYHIDTNADVDDPGLKDSFAKSMDTEGVEVTSLPIVNYTVKKIDNECSLLAVVIYSLQKILLYKLQSRNQSFTHDLVQKLEIEHYPTSIKFHKSSLYVYYDSNKCVDVFEVVNCNGAINLKLESNYKMFESKAFQKNTDNTHDSIKVLYKRKFDNVKEYQERKKQRLEKSVKLNFENYLSGFILTLQINLYRYCYFMKFIELCLFV